MKIYLLFVKYKNDDPSVTVHVDKIEAIDEAKKEIFNRSDMKSNIKEFDVPTFVYLGINLGEGLMAWVEEKEINPRPVFTTSAASYRLDIPAGNGG